ncbi:MAG: hypothetical protein QNJ98_10720 [Planctomycetota bacterium]|nr:hypothetical protein [Planctomycetota bacterium]
MLAPSKKTPPTAKKNRDQESLYKPGQLSKWFAATSVILVIGWVLMIWKDYARPWKTYQADFYAKLIEVEEAAAKAKAMTVDKTTVEPLKAARDAARADLAKRDTELAELRQRAYDIDRDVQQADRTFKSTKGMHAVAKYQFEMARNALVDLEDAKASTGDIDAAKKTMADKQEWLNTLAEKWWKDKRVYETLVVEHQSVKGEIARIQEPLRLAQKELDRALETVTKQQQKFDGINQRFGKNKWRNAPFVDFISPTIKIKQVVLDDIHDNWNFATNRKVDRCMTCHTGINIPDMGDPEIVEEHDIPPYMQAHPQIDVMVGAKSPHPMESFGCTTCHHGVGWAVDFARVSHQTTDEQKRRGWVKAHGWYKAKYIDYPMIPLEYVEGQCIKCHKAGMFEPVHYDESLDHGYVTDDPDRGLLAQRKLTDDPADPLFDSPANVILPAGQAFGAFKLPKAPAPITGSKEQVAQATQEWLQEHMEAAGTYHDERAPTRDWRSEQYWKGYDATVAYGCQGCHKIADFGHQVGYENPPKVGPDLTYLMDKVDPKWLLLWIKHPDAYRVDTKMPSFFWFMRKDAYWEFDKDKDGKRLPPVMVVDSHMTDPSDDPDTNYQNTVGPLAKSEDVAIANLSILAMSEYLKNQRNPATGKLWTRKDAGDPTTFNPDYAEELPKGDPAKGRADVNALGCAACHILPEVESPDGSWVPDGPERFNYDPLLMQGPRLTSLGSKIKSREWLNAWLKNPRHYTSTTQMPNMRIDDLSVYDPDIQDQKVLRSGVQRRADIIDYLLSFKDEAFDAMEVPVFKKQYEKLLRDMYEEFFSKDAAGRLKDPDVAAGEVGDLSNANRLATVLAMVGERLLSRNGCFGCHNVAGYENEMPIGTELSKHGVKDIHQLDFGRVPKYVKVERNLPELDDDGQPLVNDEGEVVLEEDTTKIKLDVVPRQRHEFFRNKIMYPRIYDTTKQLRWTDKLRMPRFNFRMDDDLPQPRPNVPLSAWEEARENGEDPDDPTDERFWSIQSTRAAVTAMILGLVDEPIKPGAIFTPDSYQQDIIDGRRVIKRYGCANCHTIEGKTGYLWGYLSETLGKEPGVLPPNLFSQGWRVRDEWLGRFLQNPVYLRPIVQIHMPNFGMSDAETNALVRYFKRITGRDRNMGAYNPGSKLLEGKYLEGGYNADGTPITLTCKKDGHDIGPIYNAVDEARLLFETINCNKCHLPKGAPGADPKDGGVAPSFEHTRERLRHQWVRALLYDPEHLINGTKMPSVWPAKRKFGRDCGLDLQAFQFHLRNDPAWQALFNSDDKAKRNEALTQLSEVQMDAVTDYVMYHYEPPKKQPGAPAGGR